MQRIDKTNQEKDALIGITDDIEGKSLDPYTQAKLEQEIENVYRSAMTKFDGVSNVTIEQKINNSSDLTLIEDTENIINKFLEEFNFIEKIPAF